MGLCNWATQMVCGLTGGAGVANCKPAKDAELLQADPTTVNTANAAAVTHTIKAKNFGKKEKAFAGAEKKAEEKAKGLAEEDTKLKKEAAAANASADKAEGKFKLSAMAKIGAASAATDKAEATKRRNRKKRLKTRRNRMQRTQ